MTSQLPFIDFPGETLTVSNSAVGISASILQDSASEVSGVSSQPRDIRRITVYVISGGPIYSRADGTAPIAAGTAGEHYHEAGDIFLVKGLTAIKLWKAIVATGQPDAKLNLIPAGVPNPSVN